MTDRINFPPGSLTPEDVAAAFHEHGGIGPHPSAKDVQNIALYLNIGHPFGVPLSRMAAVMRASRKEFAKTIDGQFSSALWTIVALAPKIIEHRLENIDLPTGGMNYGIARLIVGDPDYGPEAMREKYLADISRIQSAASTALDASMLFPPPLGKRTRRASWHDVGRSLAPMIIGAFRAAGRKQAVSMSNASGPGVKVMVWALAAYGEHVDAAAVAKLFVRQTRTTRRPGSS